MVAQSQKKRASSSSRLREPGRPIVSAVRHQAKWMACPRSVKYWEKCTSPVDLGIVRLLGRDLSMVGWVINGGRVPASADDHRRGPQAEAGDVTNVHIGTE